MTVLELIEELKKYPPYYRINRVSDKRNAKYLSRVTWHTNGEEDVVRLVFWDETE